MNRSSIVIAVVAVAIVAFSFAHRPTASAQVVNAPNLDGFYFQDMRFDESPGRKLPTPRIPRSWRFMGVSNGEKPNSNNLWFQDASGNIFMVSGSNKSGKFIVAPGIQEFVAAN
jgi:hypothetical protein